MKIIISPAKKMCMDEFEVTKQQPILIHKSTIILEELRQLSYEALKEILNCSEKLAREAYDNYHSSYIEGNTPALYAYQGLAYQHMSCKVFTEDELAYIEEHLRILSGLYGVLRPFDSVRPYRLEMQAKLTVNGKKDLYEYWGDSIASALCKEGELIINLASEEYSSSVLPYINEENIINCRFFKEVKGKLVSRGSEAKMLRGAMVRYMAVNKVKKIDELKKFSYMNYSFNEELSSEKELIFIYNNAK